MDIQFLIDNLTEGLPADQAAIVKSAIERDAIKNKAAGWKQQSEYDALNTRLTAMQQELEGDAASGRLGAKAYQDWYAKNQKDLDVLLKAQKDYIAKFGSFNGSFEPPTQQPQQTTGLTKEEIQALAAAAADSRIQSQYAPKWSELLEGTGTLVQKHMFAGRKTPIDFKVVGKLAMEKYNGNLEQAYEEWDKPQRDLDLKAAEDVRVEKRVTEELQKRNASALFPAGSDMSQSTTLSTRPKADMDKFDKTTLQRDLVKDWMTAGAVTQ